MRRTSNGRWAQGWYGVLASGAGVAVGNSGSTASSRLAVPPGASGLTVGTGVRVGAGVQVGSGASGPPSATRELTGVGVSGVGVAVGVGDTAVSHGSCDRPVCGPCRSQYSVGG